MPDTRLQDEQKLFSQCRICIICSNINELENTVQLSAAIQNHGGEVTLHRLPASLPSVHEFTHVVSSTIDFPGHDAACDALIPVVKPQWVNASISRNKLVNPRNYNPDPRLFLNDVVVSCVDIPEGDQDAIFGAVLAMGGLSSYKITRTTTHLVALSMDSDKCASILNRGLNIKIVLPHWFDDCIKLGRRIDERPYLLPDPEILRLRHNAPVRITENKNIIGASTPEPKLPSPESLREEVRSDLNVFEGKTVMLSEDLEIAARLRNCLEDLIVEGGGQVTNNVRQTNLYICRYREGEKYRVASRLGKDVGNLSWLFHLITHNSWISPLRRLLHYPLSRHGIPGFDGFKISLSNYAGEARIYLENLIAATGAECTKTLKQDNTHLITAHGTSEKCTAAKEWNIHVINHLWLEESYAKWQLQTVTDPRYTHFPHRTNLGEIVGQTKIDRFAIEEHFFPEDIAVPHWKAPSAVMRPKDNNLSSNRDSEVSEPIKENTTHPARTKGTPRASKRNQSLTGVRGAHLQTPQVSKFIAEGKENATPSTTGSRKSKDVAAARLQEIAPDIALYEKEKKRAGGVIYGGRRRSDPNEKVISRKRSIDPQEETDAEDTNGVKKPKQAPVPIVMHLLLTGYRKWVGDLKSEESDRRKLRNLGIHIVQDASKCTHLAAPSVLRTHKFVNAIAYAPVILNADFVAACLEQNQLLNPNEFLLQDPKSEKKYNFSLERARLKALENKNQLLDGKIIYCVETIPGGFDAFKSIIETNGGQCFLFRGRSGITLPNRRRSGENKENDGAPSFDEIYLISGTEKNHVRLWPKFRNMVLNAKKTPKIVRPDWLLNIAMAQEWRMEDSLELVEDVQMTDT
ncbi:BRCT domain-containing protein [Histoplasma capsulatum var. duboisii H88]|uniref:BRCT domain-containing protein n=1 Tax=Ajellomyces capsulatus (strain H88) TaxID=544711 RepID=F0U567_AJEC8|nr:BRCT domain-containing protein [Histoplasma capsulatum var. duboisii H88]QSS52316.1 BRCT domain-containing protein [Histoplasma capsulatum var. duboisii H88]